MRWIARHFRNDPPFQQFKFFVVREHAGIDHLVIFLNVQRRINTGGGIATFDDGGAIDMRLSLANIRFLLPAAQVAFHDAGRQLAAAGVERDALGQLRELIDEADPVHAPVVFDQRERADPAPFAHGQHGFLQRRDRAALVGRIEQVDEIAFDVRRRLAVGDDEDLLVLARALAQDPPGESAGPCAGW